MYTVTKSFDRFNVSQWSLNREMFDGTKVVVAVFVVRAEALLVARLLNQNAIVEAK